MRWRASLVCLIALLGKGGPGQAQSVKLEPAMGAAQLADATSVQKRLGVVPDYEGRADVESIKVAVLDYGFEGVGKGRSYLPASTRSSSITIRRLFAASILATLPTAKGSIR